MTARLGICAALAILLVCLLAPSPVSARPLRRVCGNAPGAGFEKLTIANGVRCQTAQRIAVRVSRRFCAAHHGCRFGAHRSPTFIFRGRVRYRGWRCQVQQGYEFSAVCCVKPRRDFFNRVAV